MSENKTLFTASNGEKVTTDPFGYLIVEGVGREFQPPYKFTPRSMVGTAIREFFQNETDKELGRWRSHDYPGFAVYPQKSETDIVRVLSEREGISLRIHRNDGLAGEFKDVATAYFEAHPPKREPWEDAEPGEVWLFRYEGSNGPGHPFVKTPRGWRNMARVEIQDDQVLPYGYQRDVTFQPRRIWAEN